jgi:transcription elongation factor SPT6
MLPSQPVPLILPPQKLEELLIKTKKEKPTFIPYFICACKELPGKFLLGYQPRGKPR